MEFWASGLESPQLREKMGKCLPVRRMQTRVIINFFY